MRVCLDDRDEEVLVEAGAALVDDEDRSGGRPDLRDFALDLEDRLFLDKGSCWCGGAMLQAIAPDVVARSCEEFEKQKLCCHCLCKCIDATMLAKEISCCYFVSRETGWACGRLLRVCFGRVIAIIETSSVQH